MEFFEFVQSLHRLLRPHLNQDEIIIEIIDNILVENVENPFRDLAATTSFSKYYNGKTSIKKISKKIIDKLDRTRFIDYVEKYLKQDDQAEGIKKNFSNYGVNLDIFNISEQLADLLYDILLEASKKNKLLLNNKDDSYINNSNPFNLNKLASMNIYDVNPNFSPNISNYINMVCVIGMIKFKQLIPGIDKDFGLELKKINDKYTFDLVPLTQDAYKKHEIKRKLIFQDKLNKSHRQLLNEANLKNEKILLCTPISIIETIDDIRNPFSSFSDDELKNSVVYIGPEQNPFTIKVNLFLYNKYFRFKLSNIKLQLLVREENSKEFYNKRFEYDWFNFKLVFKYTDEENAMTSTFNLSIKDEYLNDVEKYIEIYKFIILCRDKNATTKLSIYDSPNKNSIDIIDSKDYGDLDLDKNNYNVILHEIDVMNKLITIQDLKNVKFKFDYDYLHKNLILIEGICNYLINEESYLNSSLNWCFYKDNIDDENIKIDSPFNIITDLPYIELFDVKLILDNCKVKLKGNIINIEIKDNIKTITVKSNDVYLYKNDTCKLDIK